MITRDPHGSGKRISAGGIEIGALPAHRDVEMRACGAAGAAAQSDDLAPRFTGSPFLYFELGKMQVESEQSLAVIEHDEIAFEIKRPRQQHRAVIHGGDGSAGRDAEIEAEVRARGFAVEDALGAKDVGNLSFGGRGELSRPLALWRDPVQIVLLDLLTFCDLFLLLGGGFGELAFEH